MKKDEIKIGQTYTAKVTDKVVPVRIDAANPRGGWDATNLVTNKKVRIKSAQRLRRRAPAPGTKSASSGDAAKAVGAIKKGNLADGIKVPRGPVKKKLTKKEQEALRAQHKADQENARLRDEREASDDGMTASERAMANSAKQKPTSQPRKKREGMSCLAAAAKVLAEAGKPMATKAMVEAMTAKGYWTTNAPTPHATLYSAILREMQKKGNEARFAKVARGQFELTTAPGKEA